MGTDYAAVEPKRDEVDALAGPTLLEFGSPWCGWCRRAQPLIAEVLAAHPRVRHIKVADASGKRPVPEIEQYPIFDWIGIQANEHTLAPGRKLTLNGYGREPLGIENTPNYVDINGPAITHSYDLVMADPQRPYMPLVDRTNDTATNPNHYVWVPPDLGASIDHQTGEVTYSGRGNHPPVYALAILSVGDKATSWPIVLAPRRSFSPPAPQRGPRVVIPPPPPIFSPTSISPSRRCRRCPASRSTRPRRRRPRRRRRRLRR